MARVMIIDDDPEIRMIMRSMLSAGGHDVTEARSAKDAFDHLQPDLDAIFVDIDMPGATGGEFVMELRENPDYKDLPVTFVTAFVERAIPVQAAGLAGKYIVSKPFRQEQLMQALNAMLDGSSAP